jgi:hypothetical protein
MFRYKYLGFHLFYSASIFLSACKKGKGAVCNDGSESHSTGSGTCSWHDGVHHYIDPNEIAIGRTILLIIILIPCSLIVFQIIKDKFTNM